MEQVIDKINVVVFEVRSVSGTISRDPTGDTNVFTTGSVRYIDPSELKIYAACRQSANRLCRNHGVRFLSGWAVPDESVDKLVGELNPVAQKVAQSKADLVANWSGKLRSWQELHPEVLPYASRFPTSQHADYQIGSALSVYRIHPASHTSVAEDGIQAEVNGLAGRVLHEISQDVQDTWKPGATQASQRIKNLLGRLANKCRTLEFLGGNLGGLAAFIEEAIRRLPTTGPIAGPDFAVLSGILAILSSPEKMQATAKMVGEAGLAGADSLFDADETEPEAEAEAEAPAKAKVEAKEPVPERNSPEAWGAW